MYVGKSIRLRRIFSEKTGRTVIVPLDHGVTIGPVNGISKIDNCIEKVLKGGANGVILHKGMINQAVPFFNGHNSVIIHMSASTNIGNNLMNKVSVCSVQEAICIGADAVSIHINFGSDFEHEQIKEFAKISKECYMYGIPLMVMAYVRGKTIINEYDAKKVAHATRIAAELGADFVKCDYTGDPESFSYVIEGCHIPVVIAGGNIKESTKDLIYMVYDAIKTGAAGISIGRNIFEFKYPELLTKVLVKLVHEDLEPENAIIELNSMILEQERYK